MTNLQIGMTYSLLFLLFLTPNHKQCMYVKEIKIKGMFKDKNICKQCIDIIGPCLRAPRQNGPYINIHLEQNETRTITRRNRHLE